MRWKRVLGYSLVLFILPQLIGFLFGVSNPIWQDAIEIGAARWLMRGVIGAGTLATYVMLAVSQSEKRFMHLVVVYMIEEGAGTVLHLALGGSIRAAAGWATFSAAAVLVALAMAQAILKGNARSACRVPDSYI